MHLRSKPISPLQCFSLKLFLCLTDTLLLVSSLAPRPLLPPSCGILLSRVLSLTHKSFSGQVVHGFTIEKNTELGPIFCLKLGHADESEVITQPTTNKRRFTTTKSRPKQNRPNPKPNSE